MNKDIASGCIALVAIIVFAIAMYALSVYLLQVFWNTVALHFGWPTVPYVVMACIAALIMWVGGQFRGGSSDE